MASTRLWKSALMALALTFPAVLPVHGADSERPTLDAVLARFVDASGGVEAIRKVNSRVIKGTLSSAMFGEAKWEMHAKAPDKRLTVTEIPGVGKMIDGCDGQGVWSSNPMAGITDRRGEEADRARRDAEFYRDLRLKELYPGLALVAAGPQAGEATWQAEARTKEGSYDRFYFSRETGRLIRHEAEFAGPNGRTKTVSEFSDFRPVDGLSIPHHIDLLISSPATSDLKLEVQVTEVQQNVAIDDARFGKPAE